MAKKRPAQVVTPGGTPQTNTLQNQTRTENSIIEQAVPASQVDIAEKPVQVASTPEQAPARPLVRINFPDWPTSRPGPQSTPPPPGMRSMNPLRSEQLAEIGYNQETGEPSTQSPSRSLPDENQGPVSFDQAEISQETAHKHKKERL